MKKNPRNNKTADYIYIKKKILQIKMESNPRIFSSNWKRTRGISFIQRRDDASSSRLCYSWSWLSVIELTAGSRSATTSVSVLHVDQTDRSRRPRGNAYHDRLVSLFFFVLGSWLPISPSSSSLSSDQRVPAKEGTPGEVASTLSRLWLTILGYSRSG